MGKSNKEPDAKKAKTTSSSSLSDALFGPAPSISTSGDGAAAAAAATSASSLSAALFGGGQDTKEETAAAAAAAAAEAMASKPPHFDTTNSARFASQASRLRQRNLANEIGPGDDSGRMDGKDVEVEVEGDDDDDEVEEVVGQYSSDEYGQEGGEEKEGPDGLTNSERLYLQREYETAKLTEREWLIHQRRRRRLGSDAQIQTLNLCTETVGAGSMMPVKLWRDSAPDVVVASSKARKLSAKTAAAAGNADDPYDLINSDDEGEDERSLVLRRQQALSMCQTIMSNVGLLIIRNSTQQPSTASVSEMVDSDVEFVGTSGGDSGGAIDGDLQEPIIPPDLMNELVAAAREMELELCERLDEKKEKWRALEEAGGGTKMALDGTNKNSDRSSVVMVDTSPEDEMKMPSKETAAKEEKDRQRKRKETDGSAETGINFRYHEVASRCIGRIDSRYRMDEYPFNDPRVISNPVLLPIIKHMLGGENGNAELVYAGLIFSFPGSQNQPWHQDGEPLFPEEDMLDVPSYAFNVFIPLDDVTDELGPTEFLPGTNLSERAEEVNEELMQWAMIESKWSAAGDHKASMRMVLGTEEDEWMSRNKVVAPLLRRGEAMMYDYRTCHRGTENLSQSKTRTMLYLMYARPWLKEHLNFGTEKLFGDKKSSVSI